MMENVFEKASEASQFIKSKVNTDVEIAILVVSGLESLFSSLLEDKISIPFSEIPNFNKKTISSKTGTLLFGKFSGRAVFLLLGQYSCFEGCHITEVIFPVRVFKVLGVKKIILTSTASGVNQALQPGSIVAVRDHLNMMGINPLFGHNDEKFGPRFPDMTTVYKPNIHDLIVQCMKEIGLEVKSGVLAALFGPNSETPSETKMISKFGGDALAMGTVPEAIVANHMGMQVGSVLVVTQMAAGVQNLVYK